VDRLDLPAHCVPVDFFSMTSLRDWTGRSVINFQSIFSLASGSPHSSAWRQGQRRISLLFSDWWKDSNATIVDLECRLVCFTILVSDLDSMRPFDPDVPISSATVR
jgi:hypothetical protein